MSNHGLSAKQLNTLRSILLPFSEKIDRVGLFGSRATGLYRPNSDIDLVIYGSLDEKTMDRIFTLLNDSNLPIKIDLQVYDLITCSPLKDHIDNNMLLLFTHDHFIVNSGEFEARNDGATPISNRRALSDNVPNFSSIDYTDKNQCL
ncbi:nucleotidyltransferase domain-containing protein [Rickettsia endosymbiont of Culicoides newsteadi]|uniref:nucleotidyltransferase domain-containing protein n=1 Tax=Rickettsia endosymbiont of Culicoides newsteadi TaxID=1961830 RepID=UPI000B9A4C70|nr:nucleotidyltransferase domain-containing protein [Rickettsia endosymbiont of Culicoides newsteadi]OZG32091.1 nucleotide pyrophosphohydrolase [Rickettsia endosymbiont of Culicoides newsteadi]